MRERRGVMRAQDAPPSWECPSAAATMPGRLPGTRYAERGSATAELAVALPAVVLLIAIVLVLATSAGAQLRCADAARAGARAAALGESTVAVTATATRLAGPGARVVLSHDGDWVTVTVSRPVASGPLEGAPLRAAASAVALVEP